MAKEKKAKSRNRIPKKGKSEQLQLSIEDLKIRLDEAEETLSAIRRGAVDAIMVSAPSGDHVYTLKGAEQSYRVFFEAMNEGAVTIAAGGTILYSNGRFSAMTGIPLEKIIGSSFFDFIEEKERRKVSARLETLNGNSLVLETALRTSTKSKVQVSISVSKLRTEDGLFLCAVIRDITERLRIEGKLRSLNETLEQRVRERTAELKGYASELEASYEDLQSFSYSASHDLKSPLRIIEGFSNILLEDYSERLDEEGRKLLNGIIHDARKMSELIDDILAFSRVSISGVSKSQVDMNMIVRDAIAEATASLGDRKILWKIRDLPHCLGDRSMLRLVVTNFLTNALKFTSTKANPEIEVGCRIGNKQNVYYVRDNGIGFNMKYSHKLFNLFQRLHPSFEGTGVGLAIVKRIVEKHGGSVRAEGTPNKGATFFFSLPGEQKKG